MKSLNSDRIYLWSKRLGVVLLLAMAIVAIGNAQQFSADEKAGGEKLMGLQATILPASRLWTISPGRSRLASRRKTHLQQRVQESGI
jgi:hypothetical protein